MKKPVKGAPPLVSPAEPVSVLGNLKEYIPASGCIDDKKQEISNMQEDDDLEALEAIAEEAIRLLHLPTSVLRSEVREGLRYIAELARARAEMDEPATPPTL